MARPNVSKNLVLEIIKNYPESNVYDIKCQTGYSEPTIRNAIKLLLDENKITVDTRSRPYIYGVPD